KEFEKDPVFPAAITTFMQVSATKNVLALEDILADKKWYSKKAGRLNKIRNKLIGIEWMKPKDEIISIEKFFLQSIKEITALFESTGGKFSSLEDGVHAFRRKLRWLSIYVQSFQGAIQLTDNAKEDLATNKYLVPEIINSQFNKIPGAGNNIHFLLLEKKYFFALSWIIDALGKLKDKGHKILAVADAIEKTEGTSKEVAFHKAHQVLGFEEGSLQAIMNEASEISRQFLVEKNLDKMIAGRSSIEK
ncbi:MAG TPA: hypothetical protein VK498_01520, partial [Ferruginibacter sp.]|nr:hypothetical protein [Ferruginibacter sp.]